MTTSRLYTQQCLDAALSAPTSHAARARSIPIFRPRFVEQVLAKAHPITPIVWFGPVIAYAAFRSVQAGVRGMLAGAALFAAGWLAWTLLEYLLHRYLFHMSARTPKAKLRAFLIHGYHHQFPQDPMRLVAPPLMSWPIAVGVAATYSLALGTWHWIPLFAGTCAGYVAYDWIHYYTHHFQPRTALGKWLRSYHMLHHYDDDGTRFGISSPLWDWVFRTYRPLDARRRQKRA